MYTEQIKDQKYRAQKYGKIVIVDQWKIYLCQGYVLI